jgi:hypothetical protein
MIVKAYQFWDKAFVREIEIEDTDDLKTALNSAFRFGQNDFQPRQTPSVSVGDILELPEQFGDDRLHVVMSCGFKPMEEIKRMILFHKD